MAVSKGNLVGCIVHLHDMADQLVLTSVITSYDARFSEIEIAEFAEFGGHWDITALEAATGLKDGAAYKVRVMCKPIPYEYMGKAVLKGAFPAVLLYRGEKWEGRRNTRYKLNTQATVARRLREDSAGAQPTPFEVTVINISQGGVRIRASSQALSLGDCFEMLLMIGDKLENLIAKVLNSLSADADTSEYGCSLLAKGSADGAMPGCEEETQPAP